MRLDLANPRDRDVFFLGRFEELDTQLFLQSVLRPGVTFLDVGANVGMITLLACSLVGPSGQVFAVEPNPGPCERIRDLIRLNSLTNVKVIQVGLSDQVGELTLNVLDDQSGLGTMANITDASGAHVTSTHQVQVVTGDALLYDKTVQSLVIKIDVEGFECNVLRGLTDSIDHNQPIIVTEVMSEWLSRAGSSVDELFQIMGRHKYRALHLSTKRHIMHHRLFLTPVADGKALAGLRSECGQKWRANVVWIPQDSDIHEMFGSLPDAVSIIS